MTWVEILIGYFVTLSLLVLMWRCVIQLGRASEPPECFESDPGPQEQAENDCLNCPWREQCLGF